jgi:hypothetical protein
MVGRFVNEEVVLTFVRYEPHFSLQKLKKQQTDESE